MNQFRVLLASLVLFCHYSTVIGGNFFLNGRINVDVTQRHTITSTDVIIPYATRGSCKIDPYHKSITIRNLKSNCNYGQLQRIFSSLSTGSLPNGRLKGYTIVGNDPLVEAIWNGKNFYYANGAEHGTVTNTFLRIFQFLRATIYRTTASIDGREAFAIDYRNDIFAFFMIDFLREVQNNLYLGFVAIRGFEKIPIGYFLLESV